MNENDAGAVKALDILLVEARQVPIAVLTSSVLLAGHKQGA
jgi:hypothetical protein